MGKKKKRVTLTSTTPPWSLVMEAAGHFGDGAAVGALEDYSAELLKRIINVFEKGSEVNGRERLERVVVEAVFNENPCNYVHDLITYAFVVDEKFNDDVIHALYEYRKRGWIPSLPDLHPDERSLGLMRTTRAILAVFKEAEGITRFGGEIQPGHLVIRASLGRVDSLLLGNSGIVRLIWENPDQGDRITAVFKERGSVSCEYLREMLSSPSAALSEGFL